MGGKKIVRGNKGDRLRQVLRTFPTIIPSNVTGLSPWPGSESAALMTRTSRTEGLVMEGVRSAASAADSLSLMELSAAELSTMTNACLFSSTSNDPVHLYTCAKRRWNMF